MNEIPKILLITSKTDITTDYIVRRLRERKKEFYRLNTEDIGQTVQLCFDFSKKSFKIFDFCTNKEIDLLKIKSVYFRRPEINAVFSETTKAEANFIKGELIFTLEGLYKILDDAFWLNNVTKIRNAENKIYQILVASKLGFNIPNSIVTNHSKFAKDFYFDQESYCIIKPIKSGLIEDAEEEGVIFTNRIFLEEKNAERIESCPIYLQRLIDKKGDVRVTVVGDKVFGAFIHSQDLKESQIDWRKAGVPLTHSKIELPKDLIAQCQCLMSELSLNFGAIDFILDKKGNYFFLEINPNGQWAWIERQLDYNISNEITNILVEKTFQ